MPIIIAWGNASSFSEVVPSGNWKGAMDGDAVVGVRVSASTSSSPKKGDGEGSGVVASAVGAGVSAVAVGEAEGELDGAPEGPDVGPLVGEAVGNGVSSTDGSKVVGKSVVLVAFSSSRICRTRPSSSTNTKDGN